MKKDKEWLKEQVAHEQNDGLYFRENYSQYDYFVDVEDLLPLISQLEEPETLNEEWINEHSKCYTMENSVEISDLKNLLLPQPKKPVIPQFLADWIEVSKKHYSIGAVFHDAYDGKLAKVAIEEYIFENQDLFAQAWLDGYEVEKEKLYYVLDNKKRTLLWKYPDQVKNSGGYELETIKIKEAYTLTEKEIKDYDERFWQFALPVEEEAE